MTGHTELPTTSLLITHLGDHTYRPTFGNQRRHVAITATGRELERWTAEIRAAIGAPAARPRPNATGTKVPGSGTSRT